MKVCSKCEEKGEFFKDTKSKDGLQSQCKKCKSAQITLYLKNNPSKKVKPSPEKARIKSLRNYYKNRISMNISRRMRKSLNGLNKSASWEQLVGYTVEQLKDHLEKQFSSGMSWENYGKWHIDHKLPVSSFNITSDTCLDFKICWSLKNLQPLWKIDNLQKGNKI